MSPKDRSSGFIWWVMGFFNRNVVSRCFRCGITPQFVLMLTTTGRKSGSARQTLLQYEQFDGGYGVASARGVDADWYRNILADAQVIFQLKKQPPRLAIAEAITDPGRVANFMLHWLERHPRMMTHTLCIDGVQPPHTREKMVAFSAGKAMVILRPLEEFDMRDMPGCEQEVSDIEYRSQALEGEERPDARLWRLDELPQTRGRSRWVMFTGIVLGALILSVWVLLGALFGAWGAGLILAPLGAFILMWGVVQVALAAISMESFDD
ncbi:MAG: nitroreductase family deazaflavin-dependent oxidoreductase [Anaerolineae bacterium]|nr:nitroreductase family deazaflavin-dependent oxidoreductase [Anaerolineae bacterium]